MNKYKKDYMIVNIDIDEPMYFYSKKVDHIGYNCIDLTGHEYESMQNTFESVDPIGYIKLLTDIFYV